MHKTLQTYLYSLLKYEAVNHSGLFLDDVKLNTHMSVSYNTELGLIGVRPFIWQSYH